MKRRFFLQGLTALAAAPALPAGAISIQSTALPAGARRWAAYMTTLHQRCTPDMLRPVLRASASEAQAIVSRLLAEGVLTPAQAMPAAPSKISRRLIKQLTADSSSVNQDLPALQDEPADDSSLGDPDQRHPTD